MPLNITLKDNFSGQRRLIITQNLPEHFTQPVEVECNFNIQKIEIGYLFVYDLNAEIYFQCLRCMGGANETLKIQNTIAICYKESDAEKLMENYEVIVIDRSIIELEPILLDELHLSAPQKHSFEACDNQKNKENSN